MAQTLVQITKVVRLNYILPNYGYREATHVITDLFSMYNYNFKKCEIFYEKYLNSVF
jgi:hypothetical protein